MIGLKGIKSMQNMKDIQNEANKWIRGNQPRFKTFKRLDTLEDLKIEKRVVKHKKELGKP